MTISNTLPSPSVPLIDATGRMSQVWFQFFLTLFARTGNTQGVSITDIQTEAAGGAAAPDLAPVYAMIHAIEAMAAQAMTNGPLLSRLTEMEARLDALGQPAMLSSDVEAQIAAGAPLFTNVSQLSNDTGFLAAANNLSDVVNAATARTNLGLKSMATQAANAVAVTGGTIDGAPIGNSSPVNATFTTLSCGSFGCNGKPPQYFQAVGGPASDLNSVISLANYIRTALINTGIAS